MKNNKIMAGGKSPYDIQDNVTVHTAEAEDNLGTDNFLSSYGKFKDAKGLINAYNSLQAEFTRRCQKVKELEREIERLNSLEKPLNNSKQIFEEEREAFLRDFPEAEQQLKSLTDLAANSGDESYGYLGRAYAKKLKEDLNNKINYYTSMEYLLEAIKSSKELKDKIIRGYLDKIYESKPNIKLISGDGQACIAPPSKPKNIAEAGNIAKQIFEKYKENL